jgi:lipid-A-disaccharide synthase
MSQMSQSKTSFFILVGEKSGEEHLLSFFPKLKAQCPNVDFWGIGGDEMAEHGIELFTHFRELSTMGFSGVISKLKFYLDLKNSIKQEILRRNTKHVLLVDYQGLNYQLAKELKDYGIKIYYYVAPQVWAWKPWRAKVLSRVCTRIFSILPFEKEWWCDRGLGKYLTTVNHPLANSQIMEEISSKIMANNDRSYHLVFLPGSRVSEVAQHLPIYAKMIELLKEKKIKIKTTCVFADHLPKEWRLAYQEIFSECCSQKKLDKVLLNADLAVAASGTVTLSLGLFQVPSIICYRVSMINAFIYRTIVKYQGQVCLVNIIHGKQIFPEFLQEDCCAQNMAFQVETWLADPEKLALIKRELATTKEKLRGEYLDPCELILENLNESQLCTKQ